MITILGLVVIGCLVGAYFLRGWDRAMLILLAIAILELKSLAIGIRIFSITVILIVLVYFLRKKMR